MSASKRNSARAAVRMAVPHAQNDDAAWRDRIVHIQRARILSAFREVARERGAAAASVAHIVKRAGVSRRTFYEIFNDREDCFLAAFEHGFGLLGERVLEAYKREGSWRERIRAALTAALAFLDQQPLVAHLLIVDSQGAGAKVAEHRSRVIALLASAINGGGEARTPSTVPPLMAEGLVGGALSILHTRLLDPDHGPLIELTNPLMHMIVLPYLGVAAARRELERPVCTGPIATNGAGPWPSDPFRDANMRLTYRTVCVLTAIAESPGASNRAIGRVAGVSDQGQISKLLARLQRNGMVDNTGLGPGVGGANAWVLTDLGRQAVEGIRAHSDGDGARRTTATNSQHIS